MKTEEVKIDFSGHFLFQIFATDKQLEIDPWNQKQMIPWDLNFCRKKVPSENINPILRKPYGPIWQSKIQNSPHMIVLVGDVYDYLYDGLSVCVFEKIKQRHAWRRITSPI